MIPITRQERYLNGITESLRGGESMIPKHPLTRTETYLNYMVKRLNGEESTKPEHPLTRVEEYLDEMSDVIEEGASMPSAGGLYFGEEAQEEDGE